MLTLPLRSHVYRQSLCILQLHIRPLLFLRASVSAFDSTRSSASTCSAAHARLSSTTACDRQWMELQVPSLRFHQGHIRRPCLQPVSWTSSNPSAQQDGEIFSHNATFDDQHFAPPSYALIVPSQSPSSNKEPDHGCEEIQHLFPRARRHLNQSIKLPASVPEQSFQFHIRPSSQQKPTITHATPMTFA
jgi:hypothetical protein